MSFATVRVASLALLDHMAAVRAAFKGAISSRNANALWLLSDASADIPFENALKGTILSAVDTAVQGIEVSSMFASLVSLLDAYFSQTAAIVVDTVPVTGIRNALPLAYRSRVSLHTAEILKKLQGNAIDSASVYPDHVPNIGTYAATSGTTGTYTAGTAPDKVNCGPGQFGVIATTVIGGANLTLSVTAQYADLTNAVLPVVVPTTSAIGTTIIVGQQALAANHTASSGSGLISVAATGQFKVGQLVLVSDTNTSEVAEVVSIVTNTSLTLKRVGNTVNSLVNDYTTAASAKVVPLFVSVSTVTNSTGTNLDAVAIKVIPDRTLTL